MLTGRNLGTGIPGFRFGGFTDTKGDTAMSDSTKKELNPHDIARLFAEDVKHYADAVGSLDDLSATNVYNVLEGYEQEDSFKESMKVIERINQFETEFAKAEFLLFTIRIHERLLELSEETIKSIRRQICDKEDIKEWDLRHLIRYTFLINNLSIMKNRDYLKRFEGETEREKFVHLIFDRYIEVIGDEEL